MVVDETGTIVKTNPRLNIMFGYEDDKLDHKPLSVLLPDDIKSSHKKNVSNYFVKPSRRSMGGIMSLKGQRKDGSTFPIEVSLNYFDFNGTPMAMGLVSDITIRAGIQQDLKDTNEHLEDQIKERTKHLEESQKLHQKIARNFPNGTISVIDKNLNYIFTEGQQLYRLGITSNDLIGSSYIDRLQEEVRETVRGSLKRVFEGEEVSLEVRIANDVYRVVGAPLFNSQAIIDRVLIVEQNITAHKHAEEKILDALKKEKELGLLKSQFVSMASHEFRTPLSSILNSCYILNQKYQEDNTIKKHSDKITQKVLGLTEILNDFLSLGKLEEGKIQIEPREVNVTEFIKTQVEELKPELKEGQDMVFSSTIENNQAHLDEKALKIIITNLLSNAIKYSGDNTKITIALVHEGADEFLFSVADQGIGIPLEEQKNIFTRFFRSNNANTIQGTGLGLNIVQLYSELLNGKVWFESELGIGSTFYVKLPFSIIP